MLYKEIKDCVDKMVDEVSAGKEEYSKVISYNLIRDQNIPITIRGKLMYPLKQIKISLYSPFLLTEPDVAFEEIYRSGSEEDELRLMKLISKFVSILERLKEWIENDTPDMIRWGEGVIFDKNGRTKKIPYPISISKSSKTKSSKNKEV